MRGRFPPERGVAAPPIRRGAGFVHGLNAEHGAAVGETGEPVGVWFDVVHPFEELSAMGYLDGEGSKYGFTLVRAKLGESHLSPLLAECEVSPAGGADVANPVGVL